MSSSLSKSKSKSKAKGKAKAKATSTSKQRRNSMDSIYTVATDRTLTSSQRRSGGFRPAIGEAIRRRQKVPKGGFRFPSNPTKEGFSSGYHEAFVVTDATPVFGQRSASGAGKSKFPKSSSRYWQRHTGVTFSESSLSSMMDVGDVARTDTARTILSAPDGEVAGHSGSGVRTTNQGPAHDLLRDHSVRILSDTHLTPSAMAALASATTVASMAPGQLASTASGAGKLKHKRSRSTWEDDRNQAKERTSLLFRRLPSAQQLRVRTHMQSLMDSFGDSGRQLEKGRATSPLRETGPSSSSAAIHGGGYLKKRRGSMPDVPGLSSTASAREQTLYGTQPFRLSRL
jgi:hypothetical protein